MKGSWTAWTFSSWEGVCQQEQRLKQYQSQTKYKQSYENCVGVGPQTCPHALQEVRERGNNRKFLFRRCLHGLKPF